MMVDQSPGTLTPTTAPPPTPGTPPPTPGTPGLLTYPTIELLATANGRRESYDKALNDLDNEAACAATIKAMRKAFEFLS